MYEIKERQLGHIHLLDLIDNENNTIVSFSPQRGGIITHFQVGETEILFLDEESFLNEEMSVRGGIPILFPIAGRLTDGVYEWNQQEYSMPSHGFARDLEWKLIQTEQENHASATIRIQSNEKTKKYYPFDFEVHYKYILKENQLRIEQSYMNHSNEAMPTHIGFHPYFNTSEHHLQYGTDAQVFFNDRDYEKQAVNGSIDLTNKTCSYFLAEAKTPEINFTLPEVNKTVRMTYGEEFKYIVLWTEPEAPFICVEPWTAMPDALNHHNDLCMIPPHKQLQTHFTIAIY